MKGFSLWEEGRKFREEIEIIAKNLI